MALARGVGLPAGHPHGFEDIRLALAELSAPPALGELRFLDLTAGALPDVALFGRRKNTFGARDEKVKFMVECYNREVQGLDDVEIWIHTCWGNPNMQRVMEDTSYKASFELYLNEMRGDVWTIETKDRNFTDIELFGQYRGKLPKKVCIGAVSQPELGLAVGERQLADG